LAPTSISENEIGDRNLKPVLTQGRKENEAYKRFMTQASPRQSYDSYDSERLALFQMIKATKGTKVRQKNSGTQLFTPSRSLILLLFTRLE
jgi:hypothetical protein